MNTSHTHALELPLAGGDDGAPADAAGASLAEHRSCTCSRPAGHDSCFQQPGPPTGHHHSGAASSAAMTLQQCEHLKARTLANAVVPDLLIDAHMQVQTASRTPGAFNAPGGILGGADAICAVPFSAWDLEAPRNGASVSRVRGSLQHQAFHVLLQQKPA